MAERTMLDPATLEWLAGYYERLVEDCEGHAAGYARRGDADRAVEYRGRAARWREVAEQMRAFIEGNDVQPVPAEGEGDRFVPAEDEEAQPVPMGGEENRFVLIKGAPNGKIAPGQLYEDGRWCGRIAAVLDGELRHHAELAPGDVRSVQIELERGGEVSFPTPHGCKPGLAGAWQRA